MSDVLRIPPNDAAAERAALSCILCDPATMEVFGSLSDADFYDDRAGRLFGYMRDLAIDGPVDAPRLVSCLEAAHQRETLGGQFLADVLALRPDVHNAAIYRDTIRDKAIRRNLINLAGELREAASDGQELSDIIETYQCKMKSLADANNISIGDAVLVSMADIEAKPINWLWANRIASGKLTLIVGNPGEGKSLLTVDIAARVSQGFRWPDSEEPNEPGGVVVLSAEDDPADTIRPRLDAAGADPARVSLLRGVAWYDEERRTRNVRTFNLERDLPALQQAADATPGCRVVVIDPLAAFCGEIDSHKNADVRALLAPLADFAANQNVAVVGVTHLNKSAGTAMARVMGSLAFVAAARSAWAVVRDKADPGRRLLLAVKNNLGPDGEGLAYRIAARDGTPYLEWCPGTVAVAVDDALSVEQPRDTAKDWLRDVLADGALSSKDISREAKEAGIAWRTVRRAKDELGLRVRKDKFGGGWVWELPTSGKNTEGGHNSPVSKSGQLGHLSTYGGDDDGF